MSKKSYSKRIQARKLAFKKAKLRKITDKKYTTYPAKQLEKPYSTMEINIEELNKLLKEQEKKEEAKKEREEDATNIAEKLLEIKAFANSPIKFALNEAKKSLKSYSKEEKKIEEMAKNGSLITDFTKLRKSLQYNALSTAEAFSKSAIRYASYAADRYCSLQEDYITSQTIENVETSINLLKNASNSIIGGIMSGASIGGIGGAIVGGVTGAVSFGLDTYLNYQKRMSSYYQQLNSTNFQTEFASSRMGLINNSRGTEN